ncbi:MAG TPA: VWA domain-containing protein [Pyrinomonadaceae bacterium]|nr:VWA domain-containing protein [Pyrinomonadaceae bacterium]
MGKSDPEKPDAALGSSANPPPLSEPSFSDKIAPADRQSFLQVTREMATLPLPQTTAILETAATIGAISMRASVEFLRAAVEAAKTLSAEDLRNWGEFGRRLAMTDVETAITFFNSGVEGLHDISSDARIVLFQLCLRQVGLSIPIAVQSFEKVPLLAKQLPDSTVISVLEIASDIARRSARHSADFLDETQAVISSLESFGSSRITQKGLALASAFASRAGGIATDAWRAVPPALNKLSESDAIRLLDQAEVFLERGGGAALQLLVVGGEILRELPAAFDEWLELLNTVAQHGNASLVAFVRSSPAFVREIATHVDQKRALDLSKRVIQVTKSIAEIDGEAALACYRSAPFALRTVTVEQFEEWARLGIASTAKDARARRSYFALETRGSYDTLRSGSHGLSLDSVSHILRLYVEGLTGNEVEVSSLAAVPTETRIGDGRTIHLPATVAEFGDDELDFCLYKVLAAHAAGQIEFGTHAQGTPELRAALLEVQQTFAEENSAALDAFSVADDLISASADKSDEQKPLGDEVDFRSVLEFFPDKLLARRIFSTLENGRIDQRLRNRYRGLRRDLDLIRDFLRRRRPSVLELPAALLPFELLFQVILLGGANDEARQYYGQIVSELETVVQQYLSASTATVADSLLATSRVYALFQSATADVDSAQEIQKEEDLSDDEPQIASENLQPTPARREPQRRDARELFTAWNDPDNAGEPDELAGAESWSEGEFPEQAIEPGEVAFNYDEWDRELTDHRLGWCRVIEKKVKRGDAAFVEQTRERHRGVISSIRHQFQLMKPEELSKVNNELDGEDYDLNAVIDYVVDRKADGQQSERLYTKRLRRQRDVAVSFLLDQSSSTARTIGRHPLQPYTKPGRRIIEIEKEGLVLMSEALEAVGDSYSINGFTSEGRRNVKFYVVKDFAEHYSDEVKQKIGGITFQNNTRLGAAIRHATAKLSKQNARTRLLIVLSDGRPYDHDYGDARYAREDTREALRQAKIQGITPFCITIDRESEAELRDLYGEIGYTIIDDVLTLPERMPGIYRRLTT